MSADERRANDGVAEGDAPVDERHVLRLETRRAERRLPRVGMARFREPGAAAETQLAPYYADGADARSFANTPRPLTSTTGVSGRARLRASPAPTFQVACRRTAAWLAPSATATSVCLRL